MRLGNRQKFSELNVLTKLPITRRKLYPQSKPHLGRNRKLHLVFVQKLSAVYLIERRANNRLEQLLTLGADRIKRTELTLRLTHLRAS